MTGLDEPIDTASISCYDDEAVRAPASIQGVALHVTMSRHISQYIISGPFVCLPSIHVGDCLRHWKLNGFIGNGMVASLQHSTMSGEVSTLRAQKTKSPDPIIEAMINTSETSAA